jgi:aspartate aminotransferase
MPGISQRGKKMPASPIRKLVPYAEAARTKGVKVYHLNIGQPDIETPKEFFQAIANFDHKVLEYSHSAGFESLRKKFAQYYHRVGVEIDHNGIIVCSGASEAIRFAFMSCLDQNDEVIIPEPFYANYNGFAVEAGVKVVPITTHIENSFDLPGIEEFEKLITPRTRAIMICNPGNPTGKLYSREALEKLRDVVLKHDLYLIADEVYREFAYDGLEHFSTLNLDGISENVIVVDSISKRYSACGARIGMVVTRNARVIQTAMKFAQARLSPPTLEQVGAEAVIDVPQSYIDAVRTEYVARRDTMVNALRRIPGVLVPEVSGAFYMIVRLPIDDSDKFCQWLLESFSHDDATVMMAPAGGFYATPGLGKDEVRIAYVLKQEDLEKSVECLAEALKVYAGSKIREKENSIS